MVTPEIEMYKAAQLQFFRGSLDIIQVSDIRDPEQVAQEVEQIGKDTINVPFVTGYEAESSYNSPRSDYHDFNSSASQSSSRFDEDANSPEDNPPASAPWMSSPTNNQGSKSPSYSVPKPPPAQTTQANVLYNYSALDHTEISLVIGETITVEEKHSSGWWTGKKSNGTKGLFPSNYIEILP